jgi:hypothetical protein
MSSARSKALSLPRIGAALAVTALALGMGMGATLAFGTALIVCASAMRWR